MSTMGNSYYTEGLKNLKQGQLMKAMACFHKAGGEGHGGAMARMGYLYEYGIGVAKDILKAKEFYEKGASFDSPEAKGMLGDLYYRVADSDVNKEKGIALLKEAVKANDGPSIIKMIRYIGKKEIPAAKEELAFYIHHADKMLRQGQVNEIDLIRLIYLENGEMTDAELMQFGRIFFDLSHFEEAEKIFEGIAKRGSKAADKDYDAELSRKAGYVTAGKRAKFWLHAIDKDDTNVKNNKTGIRI